MLLVLLVGLIAAESARGRTTRGAASYVRVGLSQQWLYEVHHGKVTDGLPVSTGGGIAARRPRASAASPRRRKLPGWHRSYLGSMYHPSYFDGGYAIHGDPYVSRTPVGRGCIRIPMSAALGFYARNPVRTAIFVVR